MSNLLEKCYIPKEGITKRVIRLEQLLVCTTKIPDINIREFVIDCIDAFQNDFWYAPSSITGNYHPKDECCDGGLVLHTIRVFNVVEHLLDMYGVKNETDISILMASAILHDSFKGYKHQNQPRMKLAHLKYKISDENWCKIMSAVESHMGRWGDEKIDKNNNIYILHIADYVASRRNITVAIESSMDEEELI